MVVLGSIAMAGLLILYNVGLLPFASTYRVENPRRSFLVVGHQIPSSSEEEILLATDAASAMTALLTGWSEVHAAPQVARAGAGLSLSIPRGASTSLAESLEMARSLGTGTLVTLTVEIVGESADLQATLFDVGSGGMVSEPQMSRGPKEDVYQLVLPVTQRLLGLAGAPPNVILERESHSIEAVRQAFEGRRMLDQWELEAAERSFRGALAADSTYSRAHHDLAMTLYWQAAADAHRASELFTDVVQHTQAAVQHIERLPYRDSLHALAFSALARQEYSEARVRYASLVEADSSDVYALLLLGATEYTDEGTVVFAEHGLRPRANWNAAARSFLRAVALAPQIPLGYGYLFDLYRSTAGETVGCPPFSAFRRSAGGQSVNFQTTLAGDVEAFCPVHADSLEWWTAAEVESVDRSAFGAGGEILFQLALGELERWTGLAPRNHRPRDELSKWYLERRRRIADTPSQALADSLAETALRHAQLALAVVSDTAPERWIRLGSLHLAAGFPADALVATERGVLALEERDGPDWEPPSEAVNVYIGNARVERAIELIQRAYSGRQGLMVDPETGSRLPFVADVAFEELRLLGGLGLAGFIDERFSAIDGAWDRRGYTERERQLLRASRIPELGPALAYSAVFREAWLSDEEKSSPYWAPFFETGVARGTALDRALQVHDREQPRPEWSYVLGVLAAEESRNEDAVRLMSAVRTHPASVDVGSGGWGMRLMAALIEARALEALGDTRAEERYRGLLAHLSSADEMGQVLAQRALSGLERLDAERNLHSPEETRRPQCPAKSAMVATGCVTPTRPIHARPF
jgi:tetratricopeptide (TPR) repeat protein